MRELIKNLKKFQKDVIEGYRNDPHFTSFDKGSQDCDINDVLNLTQEFPRSATIENGSERNIIYCMLKWLSNSFIRHAMFL